MEDEIIQDETQEQQIQEDQIPDDASADDLTLEEIVNTNDEDFEKYHNGEMSANEIREKYHFKKETVESQPENDELSSTDTDNPTVDEPSTSNQSTEEISPEIENWRKVSAPFKANGKMYQPHDADDVINLMQKGANYTQKMQQIAPMRKAFETLSKNQIDENELNFLIDLHNGNKGAVKELLKRHNMSSSSFEDGFGESDNTPYVPGNNLATEQDITISQILDDVKDNREKIVDIVANKWDQASRDMINKDPNLLRLLNTEIELGRFDTIQNQVEQLKMFDRSYGPDIITYANVAKAYQMQQQQQAAQQAQQAQQQIQQQQVANANAVSKRAAAPSGRAVKSGKGKQYSPDDILNMSEEEFNKIDLDKLLAR